MRGLPRTVREALAVIISILVFVIGLLLASGFQLTTPQRYGGQFIIILIGYVVNDLVLIFLLTVKKGKALLFGNEDEEVHWSTGFFIMIGAIAFTSGLAAWVLNLYETHPEFKLPFPWNQILGVALCGAALGYSLLRQLREP